MDRLFVLVISICFAANGYAQENDNTIHPKTHMPMVQKLSLNAAIEIAQQNNPEVISALIETDASQGRILQAGRLQNAELFFEVNEIPDGYKFGDAGELDVSFNQPVEFFGKRGTRIQSAELQKKITELDYERTKKIITSQVKKVYYSGLLANQIVESIEANINLLNDFLAQVTDRYQAGTSSYLDILRAKVEITRLKNELFDARKEYRQVTGQLKILLGSENGIEYELTDSLHYQFSEISKDTVVKYYTAQSNFLKITGLQVERSKSFLSLAEKNALPDFSFGLAFQNRNTFSNGFDQFLGFNLGISLPMFYSGGVRGDIQEAEANLSISDIRYRFAKIIVEQNIRTAFGNLSFAEEQLRLYDTSLMRTVEDELHAGITAYQNRQIDLLNLFDIYRTYLATRVEYSRTVYNTLVALTELEVSQEAPLRETIGK